MEITFTDVAENELGEAVARYNDQEDGLGQQFPAKIHVWACMIRLRLVHDLLKERGVLLD